MPTKYNVVILAAGKGTRINATDQPKHLYKVKGVPIIGRLTDTFLSDKNCVQLVLVIGFKGQKIVDYINTKFPASLRKKLLFAWQKNLLGTGHATKIALTKISSQYPTFVFNGDHPFMSSATTAKLARIFSQSQPAMIITTVKIAPDSSFGRIVKKNGQVEKIVEVKNCIPAELKISEGNVGAYFFNTLWLKQHIVKIKINQSAGEYYLTDLVELARIEGKKVLSERVARPIEALGIDTLENLAEAEKAV